MIYLYFISFIVISIIDYIYVYTYLDSKLLFLKPGSKLNKYINLNNYTRTNNRSTNQETFNLVVLFQNIKSLNFKYLISYMLNLFLFLIINRIFFSSVINSNVVVLDIGYKKIELVSAFGKYWNSFKTIYSILYIMFICIVIVKINKKLNIALFKNKYNVNTDNYYSPNDVYIGSTEQGKKVYVKEHGLYQNILITGSIGSGKTSSAISNICYQLLKQNLTGIILDIKGNYVETVEKMAKKLAIEKNIIVISEKNEVKYNPLNSNVSSIELASRIKQVLCIISPSNSSDSYWLDKVENVLYNMIVLIKYYNNNMVDFREIHLLVTDNNYLSEKLELVKIQVKNNLPNDSKSYELSNIFMFFEKEYLQLDTRIMGIIKSEITRLTIPFITEYSIYNKFGKCDKKSQNITINRDNKKIYVLSINQSKNMILSKVLATFLKLEFQKEVLSNISENIKTFCICDEYQEFANFEDAHFLSLSREAKCINILSMQSYSSLINSLKNDKAALVIIQNLVNKIWFRNDDNFTVEEAIKQIGVEKKVLTTKSYSEGSQETKLGVINRRFKNKKSNLSESISYVENKDSIYNANTFTRELKTFDAICFISNGNKIEEVQKIKLERWSDDD